jgi:hypothetical protein
VDACVKLVEDESERTKLEEAGYSSIRQRDIRGIIDSAL